MTGFRRLGAIGLAKKVKVQFERAVELDGSNLDALEALQTFHFQAPAFVGGNKAEARRIADRIKQIDEERGAIAWAACFEKDKDFASAAVQYEPASAPPLAEQCRPKRRSARSINVCERDVQYALARELAPDNTAYLAGHAAFLSRRGRHAESDELFNAAFVRDPDNPVLWLVAAKAWISAKRSSLYPRARQLLERYLANAKSVPNRDSPSQIRKMLKKGIKYLS